MFKGTFLFVKHFLQKRDQIGSLLPSSSFLGRTVTERIGRKDASTSLRVLEVGPGVGPITEQLINRLSSGDTLVLVELNPDFCKHLQSHFSEWQARVPGIIIELHNISIFEFKDEKPYDFIICSLPLNNLPVKFIRDLFRVFRGLMKPLGILSYYEYLGVRGFGAHIAPTSGMRKRFKEFNDFYEKEIRPKRLERHEVWMNLPPALVNHLKL